MKHLVNLIQESLFDDDLVEKDPNILLTSNGYITIPEELYKLCVNRFKWIREEIKKTDFLYKNIKIPSVSTDSIYKCIYNEDDCIIYECRQKDNKSILFISPETICFNFIRGSETNIDELYRLSLTPKSIYTTSRSGHDPYWVSKYCFYKYKNGRFNKVHFSQADQYTPSTISKKAQNIINNY